MTDKKLNYVIVPKHLLPSDFLMENNGLVQATQKDVQALAVLERQGNLHESRFMKNFFRVECVDEHGQIKWVDEFSNLVVDAGLDDSLDKHLKGSAYTAAWYVGLTDGAPVTVAAGDTMSSHAGWSDDTTYSNGTRPTLTLGAVSGKSVDNSASPAAFNINGSATIGGAFVTDSSTKGGTTGILYGAGAFTGGDRAVISGDTVNVTVTLTAAAS